MKIDKKIGFILIGIFIMSIFLVSKTTQSATTNGSTYTFSENLTVDNNNKIIKYVYSDSTVSEIVSNVKFASNSTTSKAELTNSSGTKKQDSEIVKSGDKLVIYVDNKKTAEYNISVLGDSNADGQADNVDLVQIKKHIVGYVDPVTNVSAKKTGVYGIALDINRDGNVNLLDLVKLRRVVSELDPKGIKLNYSEKSLEVGGEVTLKATLNPSNVVNKDIEWTSNNSEVASVDKTGKVIAKKDGKAIITAKAINGLVAKSEITVKNVGLVEILPESISLTCPKEIKVGGMPTITSKILPDNAVKGSINWDVDNKDLAIVFANLNNPGTADLKGKAVGTVVVTATTSNGKTDSCTITVKGSSNPTPTSDVSVTKDGIIVKVDASKISNVTGYYFSYKNTKPEKKNGFGYIVTNNKSIEVVRLPGTTYVWVEDSSGNVTSSSISISNSVLMEKSCVNLNCTILESMEQVSDKEPADLGDNSLDNYLEKHNWSAEEFNDLIYRSARAAGLYTKEAAATVALALPGVLAQKYSIRLPYFLGGKYTGFGIDSTWGSEDYKKSEDTGNVFLNKGLDCTGLTVWSYYNAGYNALSGIDGASKYFEHFWKWKDKTVEVGDASVEIGDFMMYSDNGGRHVKIIVDIQSDRYITVESTGSWFESDKGYKMKGLIVDEFYFDSSKNDKSNQKDYKVQTGDLVEQYYNKFSESKFPSGF